MTKKLTDAQKAYNKFVARRRRMEAKFRADHRLLAAEIAKMIREDQHANQDLKEYENGVPHWYQGEWGQIKFTPDMQKRVKVAKMTETYYGTPEATITMECGSTGCIAGHAVTLAGYPMKINIASHVLQAALHDVKRFDVRAWLEERFDDPDKAIINTTECWDKDNERSLDISEQATELLKLDALQRRWLFDGGRAQSQVLAALDAIVQTGPFDPAKMPYEGGETRPDREWVMREYRYQESDYVTN